ncbi:MAG TPA: dihydrolipoamide acetyltransferase family protein [Solirubrobacterales bacterium]|nr:dihydrolipoamide acetyltransferase family protein [Solirubrobacterales bacterium]
MTELLMPRLSDSMEEGTILSWLVADGEKVEAGDEIVEIETDKATMVHAADEAGLLTILAAIGETVPVGAPIARLGGALARRRGVSVLARRFADRLGIALDDVTGSGPGGRVMKADVLARGRATAPAPVAAAPSRAAAQPPERPAAQPSVPATVLEPTRRQRLVAARMTEAKSAPEFTLSTTIEMSEVVKLRERLEALGGATPSFNDIVVRASALALREHPRLNSAWRDDRIELFDRINVGIAVAHDDDLLVPVIEDADRLSLGEIAERTRTLVAACKDGSLTAAQLEGGTFTVSNLGMLQVESFEAILNPPQAAILAVGAIRREPVVDRLGELAVGHPATVTVTCDHRVVYGAHGARFLMSLRRLLEEPLRMMG